jgi:hypothetical protein
MVMVLLRHRGYTGEGGETERGRPVARRLVIAGLALALAAMVGWFAYAQVVRGVVAGWLEAREAEGWLVDYGDLSVTGFPSAFRVDFADLRLADPEAGWVWSLPSMVLEQPALRPGRTLAIWPDEQSLASPDARLTIRSTAMTSDLDLRPGEDYALDLSDTRLSEVSVQGDAGWTLALSEGRLTMARQEGAPATYDVTFSAAGLVPPMALRARLDPAAILPDAISALDYRAAMAFDRPWDLLAIEDRRPRITRLDLHEAQAAWGGLLLLASGRLDVGPDGVPEGDLAIRAENWREMVAMAVAAGIVPARFQDTAEGVLGVVAGLSGDPEVIDATLTFSNGRSFLGPLPLGPAPRLALR